MFKVFLTIMKRDLVLAMRRKSDITSTLFFFVVVVSLFPLAIGPELETLRLIGKVEYDPAALTDIALPHDGKAEGALQVRGHWVVDTYFGKDDSALTDDGWFDTGDVSTIDEDGFMVIRDRTKDIIKSGGEWISSVDLEGIAGFKAGLDGQSCR